MSKKPLAASVLKLIIPAGQATPSPPIGPALGQKGVKAIDFCKQFNDRTKDIITGVPMRTVISVKPDRTFTFVVKSPTTSYFLKLAAQIEEGSKQPGHESCGAVSLRHIYEIAKVKKADDNLKDLPLPTLCSQIMASAKSIGLEVTE